MNDHVKVLPALCATQYHPKVNAAEQVGCGTVAAGESIVADPAITREEKVLVLWHRPTDVYLEVFNVLMPLLRTANKNFNCEDSDNSCATLQCTKRKGDAVSPPAQF